MIDWWVTFLLAFCGGFLGGTVAYWLEAYRWGVRLRDNGKDSGDDTDTAPHHDGGREQG